MYIIQYVLGNLHSDSASSMHEKLAVKQANRIKLGFYKCECLRFIRTITQTLEISSFKVRVLLLMHIRSECFHIPRAPVTFTVSVTMTGTTRPAGSNTQERRIKERLVVTLQRRGSAASQSLQISEECVSLLERLYACIHSFNRVFMLVLGDKNRATLTLSHQHCLK